MMYQVMREGMIVQAGKYNDLQSLDFKALVVAHESSMELVEMSSSMPGESSSPKPQISRQSSSKHGEANGGNSSQQLDEPKSKEGTSKLIKEEEKESGKVSLQNYKIYCTEAFGWWGVVMVLSFSLLWQGSLMAGDYWLAYETSAKRAVLFDPYVFITVYAIIAAVSFVLVLVRAFTVAIVGLTTAQVFFKKILHSILHAPMSFFDTTPSGRILSRVRINAYFFFLIQVHGILWC